MSFGNRVKELRESLNLSQAKFADKLDMKPQSLLRYEKDKVKPSIELAKKLTDMFSVNLNWLLTGKGEMFIPATALRGALKEAVKKTQEKETTDTVEINFYEDTYASAGYGLANYDAKPVRLSLSKALMRTLNIVNYNNVDIIKVYGDSMEPDFFNGEFIIVEKINTADQVKNGNTVIVNFDGEIYIKKILKDPLKQKITLISSNSHYDPIVIKKEELNTLKIVAIVRGKFKPI